MWAIFCFLLRNINEGFLLIEVKGWDMQTVSILRKMAGGRGIVIFCTLTMHGIMRYRGSISAWGQHCDDLAFYFSFSFFSSSLCFSIWRAFAEGIRVVGAWGEV